VYLVVRSGPPDRQPDLLRLTVLPALWSRQTVPVTTFLMPFEGLTDNYLPWEIGRVRLHPGASERALLGADEERWFAHEIAGDIANRVADELE